MKKFILATAVMLMIAASTNGEVVMTAIGVPTTNMPGFTTWTVNATSDTGPINGIDVTFNGAMNQVNPFGGMSTIWQDSNQSFDNIPENVLQDSQFLYKSSEVFPLSSEMKEGDNLLAGVFTNIASHTGGATSVDFAQIVVPNGSEISFDAQFDDRSSVAISYVGEWLTSGLITNMAPQFESPVPVVDPCPLVPVVDPSPPVPVVDPSLLVPIVDPSPPALIDDRDAELIDDGNFIWDIRHTIGGDHPFQHNADFYPTDLYSDVEYEVDLFQMGSVHASDSVFATNVHGVGGAIPQVPEPTTLTLISIVLVGLGCFRRSK
jgi:hypothetical protein